MNETEIQWAIRMLRSCYQDSLKALDKGVLTLIADHNRIQYEKLVELNRALTSGEAGIVVHEIKDVGFGLFVK